MIDRSVSHSEMSDHDACMLRWHTRHVALLAAPDDPDSPASIGTLAHQMIAASLIGDDPMDALRAAGARDGVRVAHQRALLAHRAWMIHRDELYRDLSTVDVEQTMTVELDEGVWVSGVVDWLGIDIDGRRRLVDHKCTTIPFGLWRWRRRLLVERQLRFYDVLDAATRGGEDEASIASAHVIQIDSPDVVNTISFEVSVEARRRTARWMRSRAAMIIDGIAEHPASDDDDIMSMMQMGEHCGHCDLRDVCQSATAGATGLRGMIDEYLEPRSRWAYRA